jgi:hypothetical protein
MGRRGRLTKPVTALMGTVGSRPVQLKPCDPESKGIVERANRYLEISFLPGRTCDSQQDFNDQLAQGNSDSQQPPAAGPQRSTVDFLDADRAMLPLPPVAPVIDTVSSVRLSRDDYVRVAGNNYSVGPGRVRPARRCAHQPGASEGVCRAGSRCRPIVVARILRKPDGHGCFSDRQPVPIAKPAQLRQLDWWSL